MKNFIKSFNMMGVNIVVKLSSLHFFWMDFTNKSIFLTGASSGLGKEIAFEISKLKPKILIISGRNQQRIEEVQQKCIELGCNCLSIVVDFSKNEECIKVSEFVEKSVESKLDIFIADHGYPGEPHPVSNFDVTGNFSNVMQVNFSSIVSLTNLLGKFITENGSIVYVTSLNSSHPIPTAAGYCCSKAALTMFMKCAALDLGIKNKIRVNTVAPGFIDTPFQSPFFPDQETQTKVLNSFGEKSPLKRIPSVQGISNLVLFLVSDLAKDITGQEHVVDCGFELVMSG